MRRVNRQMAWLSMCLLMSGVVAAQQPAKSNETGPQLFAASCSACHGLDGRGSERGPDIATRREIQRLSESRLLNLVTQGVPGTGMPAFRSLGSASIQAIVQHLRSLQGKGSIAKLPGNPQSGKELFFGTAGCSQCHMTNGQGGFIASDLSGYANTKTSNEIHSAIVEPNKDLDPQKRAVVVTTADGHTLTGVARNEDNFSLQLQTMDGTFHLLSKSELKKMERQPGSLMPTDYGSKLKPSELNDLVSYLMSIAKGSPKEEQEKQ